MAVLDTFYFLFESDAKKAKKEFDETSQSTEKLAKNLNATDKESKNLNTGFTSLVKTAGGLVAAFFSVQAASRALRMSNEIASLGQFSDMLGVSVEDVSAWGNALSRFGGSTQSFQSTMDNINSQLVETSLTGTSSLVPMFNMLGISAVGAGGKVRTAFEVLPEIAGSFERLSRMEQVALGKRMGLDDPTIVLLQKGRKEVELIVKRQKELGVVTKEQTEQAQKLKYALTDLGLMFSSWARELITRISPAVIKMVDAFVTFKVWIENNKAFVYAFITGLAAIILYTLTPAMAGLSSASIIAGLTFAAIALAAILIAGVVALVVDEIYNFIKGNDGLLSRVLPPWVKLKESIKEAWEMLKNFFKELASWTPLALAFKAVAKGAEMINDARNYQGNSLTTNSISNTKEAAKNFNIGDINILTAATDAKGVAIAIGDTLQEHLKTAIAAFDNSVKI